VARECLVPALHRPFAPLDRGFLIAAEWTVHARGAVDRLREADVAVVRSDHPILLVHGGVLLCQAPLGGMGALRGTLPAWIIPQRPDGPAGRIAAPRSNRPSRPSRTRRPKSPRRPHRSNRCRPRADVGPR